MLNGLDLFSGIGGLTIALAPWARPIAYCENDRHAQAILLSRMRSGGIPFAPIWDDIRSLQGVALPPVDIIYGGFPCQDISSAGNGVGLAGERSGLFFEIARLAKELKPAFIFLENVAAIRGRGAEDVGKTLAQLRYDCRWSTLSAAEIGAPHLRNRWWLLAAHADSIALRDESERLPVGRPRELSGQGKAEPLDNGGQKPLAKIRRRDFDAFGGGPCLRAEWWATEPAICRVADGIPNRVDRLRGLGNSVVPLQARTAFQRLMGL